MKETIQLGILEVCLQENTLVRDRKMKARNQLRFVSYRSFTYTDNSTLPWQYYILESVIVSNESRNIRH